MGKITFNKPLLVKDGNRFNYIKPNGGLLSAQWFNEGLDFVGGHARVAMHDDGIPRYYFINVHGQLIGRGYDNASPEFRNGVALVYDAQRGYNFISGMGVEQSRVWFDGVTDFESEPFHVRVGNTEYLLTRYMRLLGKDMKEVEDLFVGHLNNFDGYVKVKKGEKWNFINARNEVITHEWFDYVGDFVNDVAVCARGGRFTYLRSDGIFLPVPSYPAGNCAVIGGEFDMAEDFKCGCGVVRKGGLYNVVKIDGTMLSNEWFKRIQPSYDGIFKVVTSDTNQFRYMGMDGNYITDDCFDRHTSYDCGFCNGLALVLRNGRYNLLCTDGTLWCDDWREISQTAGNLILVKKGGKVNYMNTYNHILASPEWFDDGKDFWRGFAIVRRGDKWNAINHKGELVHKGEWFDSMDYNMRGGFVLGLEGVSGNKTYRVDFSGDFSCQLVKEK